MKPFARVFALVPDCHTTGRYARVWQRHFYDGLAAALPSVTVPAGVDFEWARPSVHAVPGPSPARDATSQRLWEQIERTHAGRGLDVIISYCFTSDVDPALIERTVRLGIPWINFFCDSTYAFDRVEALARVTSLNWFPERAAAPNYRAMGRPVLCRPYALHAGALPEAYCETAAHALGFVGAPTGNRVLRLAELFLLGCRTAVRGEGWEGTLAAPAAPHRPVPGDRRARGGLVERVLTRVLKPIVASDAHALSDEAMTPFLATCRVVLGLNQGRDTRGAYQSYLKLRDVEFPGYGCCYLTQHNEDLEHAFDVGREVLSFRSASEAASLVRRSGRDPAFARTIGRAGRRRVMTDHTWAPRLRELAAAL